MSSPITLEGKLLFPSEYVSAVDLAGKDAPCVIEKVVLADLQMEGGRKSRKPLIFFKGKAKKLVMNKTNAHSIAAQHGNEVKNWIGKTIILYPTKTRFGGRLVDCIRVREPEQAVDATGPAAFDDAPDGADAADVGAP